MNITAEDVKNLREKTGAGMMDCKKALVESNGDMDRAIDYLREKGIAKAAKKADRIAAEGLSNIYIDGNNAVIVEINSETDFVAKNEEFKSLVDTIGGSILNSNASSLEEALALEANGSTINDLIVAATAKIGEKLSLRRFERVTKTDDETFGTYLHMNGRISSLVVIKGENAEVAKDIAMQSAAMRPIYVSVKDIPESEIEHEKGVIREQIKEEGKKLEFADKIIEGRLNKFYEEVCLINQSFIKDSNVTVETYAKENNCEVLKMIRFEVGEGMEKRSDNFAEEVMSQIK